MPFITMMLPRVVASCTPKTKYSSTNHRVMSNRPRPTTVKPMTEPEENATRRPLFRLSEAACAVRALELVAIRMPMKPASIDQIPPVRKANGVYTDSMSSAKAKISRMMKTTAKTFATVIY